MIALHLTKQEATDLRWVIREVVDDKFEQLSDIGKDHPFSDPDVRDEIKEGLQREISASVRLLNAVRKVLAEGGAA